MTATTVLAAFSVLKDHVKFKINQNFVAIDNLGNKLDDLLCNFFTLNFYIVISVKKIAIFCARFNYRNYHFNDLSLLSNVLIYL